MNAGWPLVEFRERTGIDLATTWRDEMDELIRRGWAEETPTAFRLTRQGLRFADAAAEMFLEVPETPKAGVPIPLTPR